jgi:hypothetical protein
MQAAPLWALFLLRAVSVRILRGETDGADVGSASSLGDLPFYHTSEQLSAELRRLEGSCPGFHVDRHTVGQLELEIAALKKPGASPKSMMYLLFGEHSRELISPESGLHFLRSLCGETEASQHLADVLDTTHFRVVLNANPLSRRKVEAGDFCLRVNERGVDLNRNWAYAWQGNKYGVRDTNPGPSPFSEPETQLLRDDVTAAAPTAFVSVHSGTRAMFMPWAFEQGRVADRNRGAMQRILRDVDAEFCQCPSGAAGNVNGYGAKGTSMDYVYESGAQFAFLFEIFVGHGRYPPGHLRGRWQKQLEAEEELAQVSSVPRSQRCLELFNPTTALTYNATVDNWARAYGDVARRVAAEL